MSSMEEILANLTARLKSLELENESLKVESHEARDLVNRAILGNHSTKNLQDQRNRKPRFQKNSMEHERNSVVSLTSWN
ncbi:hypothetical protein BASA61_001162 [Batrachochytrium salamandrivorans]|nr:hypothetical protein BASA61_001162 [Batrachochytrium salamandrivorans]